MSGLSHIMRRMNRYRERRTVTLDKRTWQNLDRLVKAGHFTFASRAIDVAVEEYVKRLEQEGKLEPAAAQEPEKE
jgi:hypothetical protein